MVRGLHVWRLCVGVCVCVGGGGGCACVCFKYFLLPRSHNTYAIFGGLISPAEHSGDHPNSKHWFTTSFLGGRCRKAVLGVWGSHTHTHIYAAVHWQMDSTQRESIACVILVFCCCCWWWRVYVCVFTLPHGQPLLSWWFTPTQMIRLNRNRQQSLAISGGFISSSGGWMLVLCKLIVAVDGPATTMQRLAF